MTNGRPSSRVIVSLPFFLMEHLRPLELVLFRLSLSQTPYSWRLIENRAMLLLNVRFVQTDLWNGD